MKKSKPVPTITGEELAGLLFKIHNHHKSNGHIYYNESDLLKVLKAIGLPEPIWGECLSIAEFKKLRKQKK